MDESKGLLKTNVSTVPDALNKNAITPNLHPATACTSR